MNPIKRLGLIIAVTLTMDTAVMAPAFPQQNEVTTLNEKISKLLDAGKFDDAMALAQRALAIVEEDLGPYHPDVATALDNLAMLYVEHGRYAEAEVLLKRSLVIRDQAGPDHPYVAASLDNLAALYANQGRYADAEPLYERSLAIRKKTLCHNPDVAQSLDNLAELYTRQGRDADAEPLYKRLQALREETGPTARCG